MLPPILWEGEQVRFRSDEPLDRVCGGTLEHLDDRAAHIDDLFEDPRDIVDFVWAPGPALEEYCELPTLGCRRGRSAFTVFALDEHELFHALREASAQRGLEEGMAVAFGDDRHLAGEVEDSDIDTVLRTTGPFALPDGTDYPRLGHFVSYLVATYGVETLVDLARTSNLWDGYDDLTRSVEATLGIAFDDVIDDYEASYPACDSRDYRYDGFDCGRNIVAMPPQDGDEIDMTVRVACDEPTVLGPRAGEVWTMITLDVPTDGRHLISIVPSDAVPSTIHLRRCDATCDELEPTPAGGNLWMLTYCLRAGAYSLRLAVPEGVAVDFRVQFERLSSDACN